MGQTERVMDILYQLSRDGGKVTLRQMAERYSVSERQISRDIEYIRDRVLPEDGMLVFDRGIMAYRLADGSVLSSWRENILVSLAMMNAASEGVVGREALSSAIPQGMRTILNRIDYRSAARSRISEERFLSVIFDAFERGKGLIIRYRKTPDDPAEDRDTDPLRLVNYQGIWYLLAYDHTRHGVRTFRLSRAETVFLSLRDASSHDKDHVDELLSSSYGMFIGNGDAEVYTMRFSYEAGIRVSSELWHEEQKGRWVGDEYELSLPVSSPVEILSRLLSFGDEAYPVSPEDFVDLYWRTIVRMASKDRAKSDRNGKQSDGKQHSL